MFRLMPALLLSALPVAAMAAPMPFQVAGAGGAPIACTLQRPDTPKSVAALLLVQGSGPVDRDGLAQGGNGPALERAIAERLAASGIATLRCDKRGQGANAASRPASRADWSPFFSWNNTRGDIIAEWRALDRAPGIDPSHVGLLGHSEGGLVALDVMPGLAKDTPPPAALILVATPGRSLGAVIDAQLRAAMARQAIPAPKQTAILARNAAIRGEVVASGTVPDNVPRGLQALYPSYAGQFLAGELRVDPASLAASVPKSIPVLIEQGEADNQVSATSDEPLLQKALESRTGGTQNAALLPGDGHRLVKSGDTEIDPAFLSALAAWLGDHLASHPGGPT